MSSCERKRMHHIFEGLLGNVVDFLNISGNENVTLRGEGRQLFWLQKGNWHLSHFNLLCRHSAWIMGEIFGSIGSNSLTSTPAYRVRERGQGKSSPRHFLSRSGSSSVCSNTEKKVRKKRWQLELAAYVAPINCATLPESETDSGILNRWLNGVKLRFNNPIPFCSSKQIGNVISRHATTAEICCGYWCRFRDFPMKTTTF